MFGVVVSFCEQILAHKNDSHGSKDVEGCILPTLVYMAREKRPQYHTHFKAGAINSLVVYIISPLRNIANYSITLIQDFRCV